MIIIEVVASTSVIVDISDKVSGEVLEAIAYKIMNMPVKIFMLENLSRNGENRLLIKAEVFPRTQKEVSVDRNKCLVMLNTLGLTIEKRQHRFLQMEIMTVLLDHNDIPVQVAASHNVINYDQKQLVFTDEDISKKYLITYNDSVVYCCDRPEEVGEYLRNHITQYAYMKVFDNGIEMFTKQYLR